MKKTYNKLKYNHMKNLILRKGLLMMLCLTLGGALSCFAEDSYRDLLVKLSKVNDVSNGKEKIVNAFVPMMVEMGSSEEFAKQYVNAYYDSVFYKDCIDLMESVYKPLVTEQDLKNALAYYTSPEGTEALQHSKIYNDQDALQNVLARMYPDLMKLGMGEKVGKISSSTPKDYQKAFHEYYKVSGLNSSMETMCSQIINMSEGVDEKGKKILNDYFSKNIETLIMDCGYPTMTKENLSSLTTFFKSPSGKKSSSANSNFLKEAMTFGISATMKFQTKARETLQEMSASADSTQQTIEMVPAE